MRQKAISFAKKSINEKVIAPSVNDKIDKNKERALIMFSFVFCVW